MAVMRECVDMFDRGEVAGVFWFAAYMGSADGTPWEHYPLTILEPETHTVMLTDLGRHWKELQHEL